MWKSYKTCVIPLVSIHFPENTTLSIKLSKLLIYENQL